MAHIPDGVLSLPVLVAGGALAVGGLTLALRRLDDRALPKVAILAAAFFVASLIAIPIGPTSVHLLLAGLMGLVIGWATLPAIFVGLLLQTVMFGFGGLSTLGVNTVNIAGPGLVLGLAFAPVLMRLSPARAGLLAALAGGLAAAGTGGLVALALVASSKSLAATAPIVFATYLPLVIGEAIVTGLAVSFLKRVRPETFAAAPAPLAAGVHP